MRYYFEAEEKKFIESLGGEEAFKKLLEEEKWKMSHPKSNEQKMAELKAAIEEIEKRRHGS